jgi:tRNA-splicing ligase RtcB (3'-phosphate/5'-hydroxy nucleic acid ligase)
MQYLAKCNDPIDMDPNPIHEDVPGGVPLKMWTRGVPVEDEAKRQLQNAARTEAIKLQLSAVQDLLAKRKRGL